MSCCTVFKKRSIVFRTHFHRGNMSVAKLSETCDPCLLRSDGVMMPEDRTGAKGQVMACRITTLDPCESVHGHDKISNRSNRPNPY
jgi:hypothetical protein